MNSESIKRKKSIEARLVSCGINDLKIQYLPYLDFNPDSFASPFEVGCRVIVLYSVNHVAHNTEDKPALINWLKGEALWSHVSPLEKAFFETNDLDQRKLAAYSWKIEAAYTLAWSLGLVSEISNNCAPISDDQWEEFVNNVPAIGNEVSAFVNNLKLIDSTQIIDENLFNELATTYFRDLYFNGAKNNSDIDRIVSFERHVALNWLRRFSGMDEWDHTDTST